MQPEFKDYARQIVANATVLAETLAAEGFRIISGGTDTHLMLVDVFSKGILGSEAEKALGEAAITVNKNAIPFDVNPPLKPSGIRIGTPALTTRGMKEAEMRQVGRWISEALHHRTDGAVLGKIRKQVLALAEAFPLYTEFFSFQHWTGRDAHPPSRIQPAPSGRPLSVIKSPRESRHRHPADD
jgi:glycine hydroxymethyltransferase